MRTIAMCFSMLQAPRCRVNALAPCSWFKSFHCLNRTNEIEGGRIDGWSQRYITTKTERRKKNTLSNETNNLRQDISDVSLPTSTKLSIDKSEISEFRRIQYCDIRQNICESRELAKLVTVILFDLETTGFSKEYGRIIEIALQVLRGGENSTFQTLVNPECRVLNSDFHGISDDMVNGPGVPRMQDLIPILLQYVKSHQILGAPVMWVAHSARCFDVPFLKSEFSRCNFEIPSDWLFLDALRLAREVKKLRGSKLSTSLEALRKHYEIEPVGPPHRAMSDVYTLSKVFPKLTFALKLPVSGLVGRTFFASEVSNGLKKTATKKKTTRKKIQASFKSEV